ncbi:hypothetical protein G8A07_13575 [Roseateles sp. DAIF2]|uniref:PilX N-terminal domain-containing pilus assembly protein n=1 Tax=Roseateles sp. DAIF2 TaxID=2714952 RepID=UPI0018A2E43E|nr:PilX N-terminal domain-containing pilus assembly protein [Roseateles sp. DAIF2]QPF73846.1 hypothetical protein G8A07_13575 [Roseateles sp. DAIF2]
MSSILIPRRHQRGAATIVVVMVLFFLIALVAAYTNRNLVFEQRISGNHYRAALALETAEAGAEWALGLLNGGFIDGACAGSSGAGKSFRERYLNIAEDRRITRHLAVAERAAVSACQRKAESGWVCQCPSNGAVDLSEPGEASALQPMFGVRFGELARPGVVRVLVQGCTGALGQCRNAATDRVDLAQNTLQFHAALVSALKTPPAGPLTARDTVDLGAAGLGLHNTDPRQGGLLMQIGATEYSGSLARSSSTPGTPPGSALVRGDSTLTRGSPEDMFRLFFGMSAATYSQQPAMRGVGCAAGDCGTALVEAHGRGADLLWVEGGARIASNIELGTLERPVLLVVNGALSLDGPMRLNGLVYVRGDANWSNGSGQPARLTGALLSEGKVTAAGLVDIDYHAGLIQMLSNQRGSFVRVPGSWMDAVQP